MKQTITLPDYLTIKHAEQIKGCNLNSTEDVIDLISFIIDKPKDEIKTWELPSIQKIFKLIMELLEESKPQFFPIIEFKEQVYGFNPPSKMSLGEWIDIETILKNEPSNLAKLMSILYRPIAKHHYKSFMWKVKYDWKILNNVKTSPFETYTVEKYDADKCVAEDFESFPIKVANGALGFFLVLSLKSLENTLTSLPPEHQAMMKSMNDLIIQQAFQPTMDGSSPSITSVSRIYSQLQAMRESQT